MKLVLFGGNCSHLFPKWTPASKVGGTCLESSWNGDEQINISNYPVLAIAPYQVNPGHQHQRLHPANLTRTQPIYSQEALWLPRTSAIQSGFVLPLLAMVNTMCTSQATESGPLMGLLGECQGEVWVRAAGLTIIRAQGNHLRLYLSTYKSYAVVMWSDCLSWYPLWSAVPWVSDVWSTVPWVSHVSDQQYHELVMSDQKYHELLMSDPKYHELVMSDQQYHELVIFEITSTMS